MKTTIITTLILVAACGGKNIEHEIDCADAGEIQISEPDAATADVQVADAGADAADGQSDAADAWVCIPGPDIICPASESCERRPELDEHCQGFPALDCQVQGLRSILGCFCPPTVEQCPVFEILVREPDRLCKLAPEYDQYCARPDAIAVSCEGGRLECQVSEPETNEPM